MSSEISFAQVYAEAGTDYERLREISDELVPFAKHAGIEITEVGPERAIVEIPAKPHLTNHLGTVHAGALFLAADVAGAAAFVGGVAPRMSSVDVLVLRNASASFRKPANGRIRAIATVDERELRRILEGEGARRFDLDGKAHLYDDNDVLVAKFTFEYVCTTS